MERARSAGLWRRLKRVGGNLSPNIRVQVATSLLGGFYRGAFVTVWQPFVLYLGGSMTLLGLLEMLGGWGGAVSSLMQLVGGWLADRLGRRPVLLLASLFNLLAFALYALAAVLQLWPLLIPGMILAGMGLLGRAAGNSVTAESVRPDQRGLAYSAVMFAYTAPGVLSPIIGGWVAERWKYLPILVAAAILEAVILLTLLRFLRETKDQKAAAADRQERGHPLRLLKPVARVIVCVASDAFFWGTATSLLFGILTKAYGFTTVQLGWLQAIFSLSWAVAQLPLGRLIDRHGSKWFIVVAEALGGACIVSWLIWPSFIGIALTHLLLGFTAAMWVPALMKLLAGSVPEKDRGMAMGLTFTVQGLARFPSPYLAAWLFEWRGFPAPLLVGLAGTVLVVVLMVLLLKDPPAPLPAPAPGQR